MRISQILQTKRSALVVVDADRRLLGVLSERDIIHSLASHGAEALHQPAGVCMRTDVPVVKLHDSVQSAMHAMTAQRVRHLPIMDGGEIVGVVSIGDVVKSRLDEKTQENSVLQEIARLRVL
jgi:CBS domain-containing protein